MSVRIEFYGIPRKRAGVEALEIDASDVGTALTQIAERLPEFAKSCLENGNLRPGYVANVNGKTFTTDPNTPLHTGDCLLILSADAGG